MIPAKTDDRNSSAFRLYNEGRYEDSLALCNRLLEVNRDPALEVLAATNLFSLGKLEDAEVYFRDLARKMPESSHVHSYLAKVLEARGDDGAIAEYAAAARLDPDNQDALRSYAACLVARNDDRGALPVLKRLYEIGKRPDDCRHLAAVLTRIGQADIACTLCQSPGVTHVKSREYAEALFSIGKYREAADEAQALCDREKNPRDFRLYLAALARADAAGAVTFYASYLKEHPDPDIHRDYILLLKEREEYLRALTAVKKLIAIDDRPEHQLIACELSAVLGDHAHALQDYEDLIRSTHEMSCPAETLMEILRSYRGYLRSRFPPQEALERFLALVPGDTDVISLKGTAEMYRDLGNATEARSWYYRAYRSDYLNGGLPYAEFLASTRDDRECEKVLLYILANVRKLSDLSRVAVATAQKDSALCRMRRFTKELIRRLDERREMLGSTERECFAVAYLSAATDALSREDYAGCMHDCLCGLDVIPAYSVNCRPDDFLALIHTTKERMLTDCPVILPPRTEKKAASLRPIQAICEVMALSEPEQKVLTFLATHRRASETDLRKLLGTRRVAGIVNILIRKAAAKGIMLIEKKGMSAEGEIYEYAGT
ncbi:MAG TPA: hypothetical protein PKM50_03860 [Methanoregula sp.]|nr:hypothetical protein [Methanoregula sp.]